MQAVAAVREQPDLVVQAFEAGVGESEADGGEDPVAVAAQGAGELDEGPEFGACGPGQPGVEVRGGLGGVGELVEGAQLFFEQVGAVERLVGGLDVRERSALGVVEVLGGFAQRPLGVFDPGAADVEEAPIERACVRRVSSTARPAMAITWKGSKAISAFGSERRISPA